MNSVYRQLLRSMKAAEGEPSLVAAHTAFLSATYNIHAGGVLGYELMRTWRSQDLDVESMDPRLPRIPTRVFHACLDAFFVPSLDWQQRINGGGLKVVTAFDAKPQRYLTFGAQFSLQGGMRAVSSRHTKGYASLRVRETQGVHENEEVVEPPLHVSRPTTAVGADDAPPPWVGLCEGVLKSMSAAQAFGVPVLGEWCSGGGQFWRSPVQLRSQLQLASASTVVLLADAGCTSNTEVSSHYLKTLELLEDWGFDARVGWWGQDAKRKDGGPGDIDEMLLCRREGGATAADGAGTPPQVRAEDVMEWLTRADLERRLSPHVAVAIGRSRRETGLVKMSELVEWNAIRLPCRS